MIVVFEFYRKHREHIIGVLPNFPANDIRGLASYYEVFNLPEADYRSVESLALPQNEWYLQLYERCRKSGDRIEQEVESSASIIESSASPSFSPEELVKLQYPGPSQHLSGVRPISQPGSFTAKRARIRKLLLEARDRDNLSVEAAAERCGIERSTWFAVQQGEGSYETCDKFAKWIGCDVEDLYTPPAYRTLI